MNPNFNVRDGDFENPFDLSTLAVGDGLFGREDELAWLSRRLCSGSNLLLFGPDGVGKSSLLYQAGTDFAAQQRGFFIRLELSSHKSVADVSRALDVACGQIANGSLSLGQGGILGDPPIAGLTSSGLSPQVGGVPGIGSADPILLSLQQLNTLAQTRRVTIAVAFDSSQELLRLGGLPFERTILESTQRHLALAHVFSASDQAIAGQSGGALRSLHTVFESRRVAALQSQPFAQWIDRRFADARIVVRGVGATCVDLSGPNTAQVIELAQRTFDFSVRARFANAATVRAALDLGVVQQNDRFKAVWQNLSPPEQSLLIAIARNGGESFADPQAYRKRGISSGLEFKRIVQQLSDRHLVTHLGAGRLSLTSATWKQWTLTAGIGLARASAQGVTVAKTARLSFSFQSSQSLTSRQVTRP